MDGVECAKDFTEENGRRNGRRGRKKVMVLQWDKVQVVEDKVVVVARSQEEKSDFHKAILIFLPS
jgi:sporulation protein YlmC with PRC-barrel domain